MDMPTETGVSLEYIVSDMRYLRCLLKHGCFSSVDPAYGDLEAVQYFVSIYDEFATNLLQDNYDQASLLWERCLYNYQLTCVSIAAGWLLIHNEDACCKISERCEVCNG